MRPPARKSTSVRVGVRSALARATNFATTRAGGGSTGLARARGGRSRRVRATGEGVGDARSRRNAGALLRARPRARPRRRRLGARREAEFRTSRDAPVRHTPGTTARSPRGRTPALSLTSSSRRPRSCGRSTVACAALSASARLGRDSAKKCAGKKCASSRWAEDDLLTEQILYPVAFGFDRTA